MISSRSNPLVKRVRALQRSRQRAETGLFLAEGAKVVGDALAAGVELVEVVVSPRLHRSPAGSSLRDRFAQAQIAVAEVTDDILDALSPVEAHQGVIAVLRRQAARVVDLRATDLLVVLHGLRDPGNVGAVIRSAAGLGAAGALIAESADPWGPKAVRAAAGALFRLPVAVVEHDLATLLGDLPHRVVAAVARGGQAPEKIEWARPVALLLGAEGDGLSAELRAAADVEATIPLTGGLDSLNVAAAAAILLHAAASHDS